MGQIFWTQKHQTTEEEHDVTTTIFDPTWRVKRVSLKHSTCAICASVDCHDCSFLSTVHDVGAQWVVISPFSMGQSQSDSARVSGYVHCDLLEIMQPNQPKHDHYSHSYYLVGGSEHFYFVHIVGTIIPTDFHIFQRG